MEGKVLAERLNDLAGGEVTYGYDQGSNKIFRIEPIGLTESMSIEKATNELRARMSNMFVTLRDIFQELVEEKPASNGENKNAN